MAFCDRLKEARIKKGLTQAHLGELIGVAKSTVTGYEKGTSQPDEAKIIAMMTYLGVDANYLWQDSLPKESTLGSRIRELRESLSMKQETLAARAHVTVDVLDKWERDILQPDTDRSALLCHALGTTMSYLLDFRGEVRRQNLPADAHRIGRLYNEADAHTRAIVELALLPIEKEKKPRVVPLPKPKEEIAEEIAPDMTSLKTYTQPSAAGLGNYLDDDSYDIIEYPNVPARADIAVRISGDSMEPKFFDGDIVFVETESVLDDGEIGIFFYNGQGYLKKIRKNPGRLVSLNPRYEDIILRDGMGFRVVGRVVGVAEQ